VRAPNELTEKDLRAALAKLLDERDAPLAERSEQELESLAKWLGPLSALGRYKAMRQMAANIAKALWRSGDGGERLRRLFPEIPPDAIREAPPGTRGVGVLQLQRMARRQRLTAATADVLYLERLWHHQNPRWPRKGKRSVRPLVIEIVAERHGLATTEVKEEVRRGGDPFNLNC
jgi:hypothetical protein